MLSKILSLLLFVTVLSTPLEGATFLQRGSPHAPKGKYQGPFKSVRASGPIEVILKESDTPHLQVKAPEHLKNKLRIKIDGGVATIRFDENFFIGVKKDRQTSARVLVYHSGLENIELGGSVHFTSDHKIKQKRLQIVKSGSSSIWLHLNVDELVVNSSGSGQTKLRGEADFMRLLVRGSASFDGKELEVRDGEVSLKGSSKIVIHAKDSLKVQISGSSSLRYLGDPKLQVKKIQGSGTVRPY